MDDKLKYNNFDLLRIFAATQVVLSHGTHHLDIARPSWWALVEAFPGVPIFFVISGFLISASYERSSSLASYARNRVLRIYPGLWCCVLLTLPIAALFGSDVMQGATLKWLAAQLAGVIYTPAFMADFGFGSYNGSLWTIPIELQFYVVLPLLYWAMRRLRQPEAMLLAAWIVMSVVGFGCRLLAAGVPPDGPEPLMLKLLRYSFVPHIYLFLTGVVLQRLGVHRLRWVAGQGGWWVAAFLAFHFLVPGSELKAQLGLMLLGVASISVAYTGIGLATRLLRGNDVSYGVYIYHGLLLNVFIELGWTGQVRDFLLLLALTFAVASLSWVLVEKPFIRRKKQSIAPSRDIIGPKVAA